MPAVQDYGSKNVEVANTRAAFNPRGTVSIIRVSPIKHDRRITDKDFEYSLGKFAMAN